MSFLYNPTIEKIDFNLELDCKRIPECPGVYTLINNQTLDFYIGSSKNLRRRIKDHRRLINKTKGKWVYRLQKYDMSEIKKLEVQQPYKSLRKIGCINCSVRILRISDKEDILKIEEEMIHLFNPSLNTMYNIS